MKPILILAQVLSAISICLAQSPNPQARVAGRSKVLGPPPKETPVTFSAGGENRALQPDILIMLRADSKRKNEYSSEFNVENTTGGTRVPGPFVRHRVLAGAGR
jgi:hypothetical protein